MNGPRHAWLHWCGHLNAGEFTGSDDICAGCRSSVDLPLATCEVIAYELMLQEGGHWA